ncbi:39510_t:CDS:2, partial [Gigaspora margarita]
KKKIRKEINLAEAKDKAITDALKSEYSSKYDKKYNLEEILKEKYWKNIVKISIKVTSKLYDEVNDFLKKDNSSLYLKIAYNKVLFSIVFTEKKKYYGTDYIKVLNF